MPVLLWQITGTQGMSPTARLRPAETPVCSGSSGGGLGWGWLYGQDNSWWVGLYCILLRDQVCRLDRLLRASWSQREEVSVSLHGAERLKGENALIWKQLWFITHVQGRLLAHPSPCHSGHGEQFGDGLELWLGWDVHMCLRWAVGWLWSSVGTHCPERSRGRWEC